MVGFSGNDSLSKARVKSAFTLTQEKQWSNPHLGMPGNRSIIIEIDKENEDVMNLLRNIISDYLDDYVKKPTFETIEKDIVGQDHLASLLLLTKEIVNIVNKEGPILDKDHFKSLSKEERTKRKEMVERFLEALNSENSIEDIDDKGALDLLKNARSKKYLMPYFTREINWIIISILSTSYVSALILMRAVFELTIGIATRLSGSMNDKIDSITYFEEEEKKNIKKQWRRLCAWGHPYGKWLKEVCPIFTSHKPLYHPQLFALCVKELTNLIDLFLVTAMFKYQIKSSRVQEKLKKLGVDLSTFALLRERISN